MGLSVGVVSIDYCHDPPQPIPDFFRELVSDPNIGDFDDDLDTENSDEGDSEGSGYLCGAMDGAGILVVHRYGLMERAENWCCDKNFGAAARDELLAWLANLPWKDGYIRLHLVF